MIKEMSELLRILAKRNPRLWEAIEPHTPAGWVVAERTELSTAVLASRDLEHSVKELVRAVAEAAIAATAMGLGKQAEGMLSSVDDDICGNDRRWPPGWPVPGPWGEEDLRQDASAWTFVQAQAALGFGYYAANVSDERLSEMFGKSADRLATAALASTAS